MDAVGAIVNEVYYHSVKTPTSPTDNTRPANAPVSYPFIWDTPQQELEQWIGIAKSGGPLDVQSLSRNVGEVLGVFADFVIPDDPTPLGYSSSVKVSSLVELEKLLKGLWSPQWPADFPPINQADAAKGTGDLSATEVRYMPHPGRQPEGPESQDPLLPESRPD